MKDIYYLLIVVALYTGTYLLVMGVSLLVPKSGARKMNWIVTLSALLAAGLFFYLVFALVKPEKF